MVVVYCVFDKCGNQRKKNSKISFFSFPKEEELLQKWLDFVNKHNRTQLDEKRLDRDKMKICHMHFEKRQVQTKSNNDRTLVRNSVPRCPPGIVDKAHALKKSKAKKKSKKSKAAETSKSHKSTEESPSKPNATLPALEGNPLYHTINGYVVDLRIAAQQDTFRLPNGKLIQVRRQPKKGSDSGTDSARQSTGTDANKTTASVSADKDTDTQASGKNVNPLLNGQTEPPLPIEKPSKTYTNRRTLNQPPRTSPIFRSGPVSSTQPSSAITLPTTPVTTRPATAPSPSVTPRPPAAPAPSTPSVTPRPATAPTPSTPSVTPRPPAVSTPSAPSVTPRPPTTTSATPSLQPSRTAVIVPPSLTALQALIYKTHPDTRYGKHLKEFESRLISTAELSLHVVNKLNNFLHSNPYRNAGDTRDLKDLYHHVAYILRYAVDRFTGLEDYCVQDIQQMGFTKPSDLGPLLSKQPDKPTPPKSPETEPTAPVEAAEPEAEAEEDDDCAIIEERTDVIEVDSDDDDESGEDEESDNQTTEHVGITLNPKQLRICSDTESVAQDEESDDSERVEKVRRKPDSETQERFESTTDEPVENETHTEEETQIEVVMNEVEETTIVQDYYYAELSEDEDDGGETMEQSNPGGDEVMDLGDDEESGERVAQEDDEETEELIEIIEGDIDLELEDGQEYKVIEVIDGDYDMF